MSDVTIPERVLFVWFGRELPAFAELAIRSAHHCNPRARLSLLHGDALDCRALASETGLVTRRIEIEELLAQVDRQRRARGHGAFDLVALGRVWSTLASPAARSNLVRLLALYAEGGVYLDTDTLTLRSLAPLLDRPAFCGLEHILWPSGRLSLAAAQAWPRAALLTGVRYGLAHVAHGYRLQRRLLPWYDRAVNNAVLGFAPGHALLHRALERIAGLPAAEWTRRFRLGTHLLQEVLAEHGGSAAERVDLLPPEHFYPLGPVTSAHYFKRYERAGEVARELVPASTYVVHWYASVSDLSRLAPVTDARAPRACVHLYRRALGLTA